MISRWTIGRKLTLSFSLLLALGVIVAVVAWNAISTLGSMQDELYTIDMAQLNAAQAAKLGAEQMRAAQLGFLAETYANNGAGASAHRQGYREAARGVESAVAKLAPLMESDEEKAGLQKIRQAYQEWGPIFDRIVQLCESGDAAGGNELRSRQGTRVADALIAAADGICDRSLAAAGGKDQQTDRLRNRNQLFLAVSAALLLATALGGIWAVRQITGVLRGLVGRLFAGANEVAGAASQVSAASQSLAQGTSEQAASLEETSASSEEINSMAASNTENSRAAAGLVEASQQRFNEANRSLERTLHAMGEIHAQSGKISKIIKTIDEIAFQTNILALNAAVEAARAGEAGMGFAVVADEVRNLAQRSAQAARDTAAMIEESIAKSAEGKGRVDEVASSVRAATEDGGKIQTLVEEVNNGSQEQARGIDQIAKAIAQMEQMTQRNAASAEQSAAASQELNAQAETLREIAAGLTAMVGGGQKSGAARSGSIPANPSGPSRGSERPPAPAQPKADRRSGETERVPAAAPAGARAPQSEFPLDGDF